MTNGKRADMIFPPTKNVPRRPPDSLFGDNSRRVGAWADGNRHAPSKPLRGARERAVARRIRATVVKAAKRTDEAYKADVKDPVYLECMAMVNNLCSWIKRYLWRFTGMDPANLQSYLNWYVNLFRVNQAQERWPKTERVVRHLLMAETQYRSSRA